MCQAIASERFFTLSRGKTTKCKRCAGDLATGELHHARGHDPGSGFAKSLRRSIVRHAAGGIGRHRDRITLDVASGRRCCGTDA